ncbi:MAG: zinc-binding dehydrogenase, partial [Pirellula sp.]
PWSVACIEKDEYRRQLAMRFGATVVAQPGRLQVSDIKNGYGFDVAIECSGTNAGLLEAIELVRVGGRIVLVGAVFPSEPAPLIVERIVRKHLTLHGVHNYRSDDLLTAVDFMERQGNSFPFEELVSHVYPLAELADGITAAKVGSNIRVAIAP